MKNQKLLRQGDLGFAPISKEKFNELLKNNKLQEVKSEVLALGETTGHKHTLVAERTKIQMFKLDNGMVLFKVAEENNVKIQHNVHQDIKFNIGYYLFDNQFEWNEYEEMIRVKD